MAKPYAFNRDWTLTPPAVLRPPLDYFSEHEEVWLEQRNRLAFPILLGTCTGRAIPSRLRLKAGWGARSQDA